MGFSLKERAVRSSDFVCETPEQLLHETASLLAVAILRLHSRGVLSRSEPGATSSENPLKSSQDSLELSV
jgi:hypothetical protein